MNIGIIGYGSMGRMLLGKFHDAGPGRLYVANRTPEKLADVPGSVTVCCSNAELASCADIVFLCVRPADLKAVLEEIRAVLKDDTLLVSLNGSVTFDQLGKIVTHRMAKAIPSVAAEIGRSQTLVCFNDLVHADDREMLKQLLAWMGEVIELPEKEMGMGSELVSCMPGFIASIFDVICREAGRHTAIPEDQIIQMVLNTVCATGELMLAKKMTFGDVVSRVATKGGITEEGAGVIYERFPETARQLFEKTLEKRRLTAERAEALFN
ncbi:MAG: NAD(P)-binding domain-containing protein [Clostridia bacterium]|nr:NAD(P)-binding domain-containing protein [Clostridia bacterium]